MPGLLSPPVCPFPAVPQSVFNGGWLVLPRPLPKVRVEGAISWDEPPLVKLEYSAYLANSSPARASTSLIISPSSLSRASLPPKPSTLFEEEPIAEVRECWSWCCSWLWCCWYCDEGRLVRKGDPNEVAVLLSPTVCSIGAPGRDNPGVAQRLCVDGWNPELAGESDVAFRLRLVRLVSQVAVDAEKPGKLDTEAKPGDMLPVCPPARSMLPNFRVMPPSPYSADDLLPPALRSSEDVDTDEGNLNPEVAVDAEGDSNGLD